MATVTIGKSYFEALLRRAEFHTSGQEFDTTPSLSTNVTISKAEHDHLLQAVREYNLLKNSLFRGGLSPSTLETLLDGEKRVNNEQPAPYHGLYGTTEPFTNPKSMPVTMAAPPPPPWRASHTSPDSEYTDIGEGLHPRAQSYQRNYSFGQPDSSIEGPERDDDTPASTQFRVPVHDQRTVLISNLSDRTTHKDLVGIIRGGRLLDIYIRSNDRTATVSFVEGAQEFLAYTKRNDIYLLQKRLEFRWADRQFHVPPHVSNKIANGATRNVVVRGAVGKFTEEQIRDHLDHIHNLVVIDIKFRSGDAWISLNSIHNSLFARTCMMSRTLYKGMRIEWYPDECAAPLPTPPSKPQAAVQPMPTKTAPIANPYALLDIDGSEVESEEDGDASYMTSGVMVSNAWADTVVA